MSPNPALPRDQVEILLLEGIHESALEYFVGSGFSRIKRHARALADEELKAELDSAHVVGIRSRTQLTDAVLANARHLLAVGCFCIGTNQVDLASAARRGVPVFNAPHSNTRSVAELMIAEMIMLARGLGDKNTQAHAGQWSKSAKDAYELRGKTVGIVGYGHIGSQVSILAEAMGMTVLYHDILRRLPMGNARQVNTLDELLSAVDFVTLHVPEDPGTRDLIGERELALMRPGSYLLNASRGSVVIIDDLAKALCSGHLGGAAVDVFPKEPASNNEPFESPLRGLSNVILTPHVGGSTLEAQKNIGVEVASKLGTYVDSGGTVSAVNFPELSLSPRQDAHRLLHIHHNRPGVLAAVNRALASSDANIVGQHLQTRGELGYVVIDLNSEYSPELTQELELISGTIRVRVLY